MDKDTTCVAFDDSKRKLVVGILRPGVTELEVLNEARLVRRLFERLRRAELDREIVALAQTAPYREPVGWLRGFRAVDTLTAMILLV